MVVCLMLLVGAHNAAGGRAGLMVVRPGLMVVRLANRFSSSGAACRYQQYIKQDRAYRAWQKHDKHAK